MDQARPDLTQRRPLPGRGLSVRWDRHDRPGAQRPLLDVLDATHLIEESGRCVGAVYSPMLTRDESRRLVARLLASEDPGGVVPEVPWAAAVLRPESTVVATASMMLTSGLFYRRTAQGHRGLATVPLALIEGELQTDLDYDYLREFAARQLPVNRTPWTAIRRAAAGDTLVWSRGAARPTTTAWCAPDTLPEPHLIGRSAVSAYLELFDLTVARLAERAGPLVAQLSGGLDSTFTVAALTRAAHRSQIVRCLCHSPLPDAATAPVGIWDPDDLPWAHLMRDAYPGRITVEPVRNTARIQPLDAAAEAAGRTGMPTYAPGNQVWMDHAAQLALSGGATTMFHSSHGNATLSNAHNYASAWYLDQPTWPALQGMTGITVDILTDHRHPLAQLRRDVAAPLRRYTAGSGSRGRATFLDFLTRRNAGHAAAFNPAQHPGLCAVDPFLSRELIELAAAITPRTWRRGPAERGFARRAATGRVPDAIRLRARRGGQGFDTWFVIATQPRRTEAALRTAEEVTATQRWIDAAGLRTWWRNAVARGPHQPPPPVELNTFLRTLATAEFAATAPSAAKRTNRGSQAATRPSSMPQADPPTACDEVL